MIYSNTSASVPQYLLIFFPVEHLSGEIAFSSLCFNVFRLFLFDCKILTICHFHDVVGAYGMFFDCNTV